MTETSIDTAEGRWQFWIDRGGTFTDVVARRPDGSLKTLKLLSDDPARYEDAAVEAIRRCLGLPEGAPINPASVAHLRLGTTVATNALLERRGTPTALVVTEGFGDVLKIGYQNRPDLFARKIERPDRLYERVIEVRERLSREGDVLVALDEEDLRRQLILARGEGIESLAIVFLHGYCHSLHERAAAAIAGELGFDQVSMSHAVSPLIRFVARADTTTLDAYLQPVIRAYTDQLQRAMGGLDLLFMSSSGGLTPPSQFRAQDAILSGPAGGIVAMARTAADSGFSSVIGFDMGGTSTDISVYAGCFERVQEVCLAGIQIRAPLLNIQTIAAGGGSVLRYDGERCQVGPRSAGALPGPACYGRGGPLTLTDANVLVGKILPDSFPSVFGPRGEDPLNRSIVTQGFRAWADQMGHSPESVADGFIEIAVQQMAKAIRRISLGRGHDLSRFALQCFGGAGGQHACRVAEAAGLSTILIHPLSGVLSAYGMGLASRSLYRIETLESAYDVLTHPHIGARLDQLKTEVQDRLAQQLGRRGGIEVRGWVHLRPEGGESTEVLSWADPDELLEAYRIASLNRHAYCSSGMPLVAASISAEAFLSDALSEQRISLAQDDCDPGAEPRTTHFFSKGRWETALVRSRAGLKVGCFQRGPAILIEPNATTVIEADWTAEVDSTGMLILRRDEKAGARSPYQKQARDPIRLELFNHRFMQIAEEMGQVLASMAHSVNIRERLDFSCAIFDAAGQLVANAPHVPVHLGSMGESVRAVRTSFPRDQSAGDSFLLNDPYLGGTHLPDMTVVTPVFIEGDGVGRPSFYVASRGHHADIGGMTPGSMPAFSKELEEEGVCLPPLRLVAEGTFNESTLLDLLQRGRWPCRNPSQNIADLKAQLASNQTGVLEIRRLCLEQGAAEVKAYMGHIMDYAESRIRLVLEGLAEGRFEVRLDHGAEIVVCLRLNRSERTCVVDFSGTSAGLDNNFNCPKAVARAAVLYVFRTLLDEEIPLNEGCLRPLTLIIPEGSMLDPQRPAPVVAGNVETSTCIVNALYGALGIQAAGQPTMNNLSFGNAAYQYYETLAGGSGAGRLLDRSGQAVEGFEGASAIQAQMTNSRLTDPEILEMRYPVRVVCHAIRYGSGGSGRWRGGDGAIRRLAFLAPMTLSLISNGRRVPAFGLEGGGPGALGENRLILEDGTIHTLGSVAEVSLKPGDVLELLTPGGGGFGSLPAAAP